MNQSSVRRFLLPAIAGAVLLAWSTVASAGMYIGRSARADVKPAGTPAPHHEPARYVAPRNIVPVTAHQSAQSSSSGSGSHAANKAVAHATASKASVLPTH